MLLSKSIENSKISVVFVTSIYTKSSGLWASYLPNSFSREAYIVHVPLSE